MITYGIRRLAFTLASLHVLAVSGALAQVPGRVYGESNGLCDPDNVNNCVRPNADGSLPISGTFTASVGGFAPSGAYASLDAGTSSGNVALPPGSTIVVYNTGSADAYVAFGTSNAVTATTGDDVVEAGAAIALAPGANTWLAAITASGSTTLTLSGGAGLYSGVGAGGSGGGGTLAQGSAAAASGAWPVKPTDGTNVIAVKPASTAPLAADTAEVVTQRPDGATVAGSAPGTAGSASASVVSVQGVASMTPLKVDGSGVTQPVSGTFWQTTQPVSATSLPLPSGAATSANQPTNASQGSSTSGQTGGLGMGAVMSSAPSYTPAQTSPLSLTTAGALRVDASATTQPVSGTVSASPSLATSGGLTAYFLQPAASDNHANIKNGAGQIYHVAATNNSATINYVRFYDAASGFNGCGSATNLVYQLAIPATSNGAGFVEDISQGIAFSTGISICVTSGYATTDETNATASAISLTVGYK